MAKRRVVWTFTAARQRKQILEYWYRRNLSPDYSLKLIEVIESRLRFVSRYPFTFQQSSYVNTRCTTLGNYSIYYQVFEASIIVTAFWDNRQDPEKLTQLLKE